MGFGIEQSSDKQDGFLWVDAGFKKREDKAGLNFRDNQVSEGPAEEMHYSNWLVKALLY